MNKIEFDKEAEVMSVMLANKKSIEFDVKGNVVIDYAKDGEIVKINFYNFSFDLFKKYQNKADLFIKSSSSRKPVMAS